MRQLSMLQIIMYICRLDNAYMLLYCSNALLNLVRHLFGMVNSPGKRSNLSWSVKSSGKMCDGWPL